MIGCQHQVSSLSHIVRWGPTQLHLQLNASVPVRIGKLIPWQRCVSRACRGFGAIRGKEGRSSGVVATLRPLREDCSQYLQREMSEGESAGVGSEHGAAMAWLVLSVVSMRRSS